MREVFYIVHCEDISCVPLIRCWQEGSNMVTIYVCMESHQSFSNPSLIWNTENLSIIKEVPAEMITLLHSERPKLYTILVSECNRVKLKEKRCLSPLS